MRALGMMAVLALLGASGCSYRDAMAQFCEDTGSCECTDGDCCSLYDRRCGAISCCGGMVCSPDGFCLRENEPKLVFDDGTAKYVDLPAVDPGQTSEATMTLRNVGTGPTTQLQLDYEGTSRITADLSLCSGRILQPQEGCTVKLVGKPTAYGDYVGTVTAKELGTMADVYVRITGGALVEAIADFRSQITSEPAGISCPETCEAFFPVGTQVTLLANTLWWGWHTQLSPRSAVQVSCVDGATKCDFIASTRTTIAAQAEQNLWLTLSGSGSVSWRGGGLEGTCNGNGGFVACPIALQDAVTLTVAAGTASSWTGPCAGSGQSCALTVPAHTRTDVSVTLQ